MEKPLISVCIPVYNVSKYLSRCIDSIINQTHKELDIIIIDDGSTDNSAEICNYYRKKDHRIRFFHQENHGLSYTRKRMWKLSYGDYISYIDSDDYIETNTYELLLKFANGADIIQFGFLQSGDHFDKWKDFESRRLFSETEHYLRNQYLKMYLHRIIMPALWQRLFKKSTMHFSDIRCYFSSMEDHFNFPFILWGATDIRVTNRPLYHWETRIGSLGHPTSVQFDRKSAEDRFISGISILDFIGVYIDELSDDTLLYAADYLESYLCQTVMHINRVPEMETNWIKKVFMIMLQNNTNLYSTINRLPLSRSSLLLFQMLENIDNNESAFKEYVSNDYLSEMSTFLEKFKFNG